MHISGLTGSQVWLSSARSLTNIGSGALASTSSVSTSLAAASFVDLRPSAGTVGIMTNGIITGGTATGASSIAVFDGTIQINVALTAAAANSATAFTSVNTSASGVQLHNADASIAARYQTSAWVFTI